MMPTKNLDIVRNFLPDELLANISLYTIKTTHRHPVILRDLCNVCNKSDKFEPVKKDTRYGFCSGLSILKLLDIK